MNLLQTLKEVWQGTGICTTGNCQNEVPPHVPYCESCSRHMDALRTGSTRDRERAYVRANIREWKQLMEKYPDIQ